MALQFIWSQYVSIPLVTRAYTTAIALTTFAVAQLLVPFVLALPLILGNSLQIDLIGIAVGHTFYFLEDVFPDQPGGFRILITPRILQQLFEEDEDEEEYYEEDEDEDDEEYYEEDDEEYYEEDEEEDDEEYYEENEEDYNRLPEHRPGKVDNAYD
ncbi:unnamed protein product [Orchesella dallaii]|uniref:Derlin n=1 Tax=Orchesella dallaii TaxID=48710 RepID=A0ABP1RKT7_9HEXA